MINNIKILTKPNDNTLPLVLARPKYKLHQELHVEFAYDTHDGYLHTRKQYRDVVNAENFRKEGNSKVELEIYRMLPKGTGDFNALHVLYELRRVHKQHAELLFQANKSVDSVEAEEPATV